MSAETGIGVESDDNGRWQWHPRARESWAGERLHFWRVSFPTYDREALRDRVREVMRRTGVLAYAVYELYGGYDLLLRVWLPTTHGVFEATFDQVFQHDPNIVIESFSVTRIVTLWPWADADGTMREPREAVLAARLPNAEIRRINAGLPLPELATYEARDLLAPAWPTRGIKFIVLIGSSRQPRSKLAAKQTRDRLAAILRDAKGPQPDGRDAFIEKSLYEGIGFSSYLIVGRVQPGHFSSIERAIVKPINDLISPETFGARTTTFVMSTEDFLDFREEMRTSEEAAPKRTAQEWLLEEESQTLEIKGSAFRDLHRWLLGEMAEDEPPVSDVPLDSLAKAVVGFLNADGGAIVVGALEARRYERSPRLADAPRVGDHLVWGLALELPDRSWDLYAQRLRDKLESRIKPNPNPYLDVDRDGVGKRPLAVVTVREPRRSSAGPWFYHYPKGESGARFWVREGNRTVEKVGPEIDAYKAERGQRPAHPGGLMS